MALQIILLPKVVSLPLKLFRILNSFSFFRQSAFNRKDHFIQQLTEFLLIWRAMKTFIKRASFDIFKFLFNIKNNWNSYLIICLFFHNLMLKYKTKLIRHYTNPYAELLRHTSFPLAYPFRTFFKNVGISFI